MFLGGKTPLISTSILKDLGYKIIIVPSDMQRAAIHAMSTVLKAIKQDGDSRAVAEQMTSFDEREEIVGTADYMKKEALYSS